MTAHIPPAPPAMRERKLESVCFEASRTSVLTSSGEGIEGPVDDDDEDEGIIGAKGREKTINCRDRRRRLVVGWWVQPKKPRHKFIAQSTNLPAAFDFDLLIHLISHSLLLQNMSS